MQNVELAPTNAARYRASSRRRVLCLFPRYTRSFGTMHYSYKLMPGVKAFMPPQGILVMAAYLPQEWEVRFIDENLRTASDEDYLWAEVVLISGMHVQRKHIEVINERAHSFNKLTVLGGPSVSGCPEWYPGIDILHCGELGDATDKLIARIDQGVERPEKQECYITLERLPLAQFPCPAYHLIDITVYFLGSVQWSSGCPYRCEFCDIPELYGRNPRLKAPSQVTSELDAMLEKGNPGSVYFVDDNFVGNQKAAVELLTEIVAWQKKRGYPLQFACEGTLNVAKNPRILELMKEAYFVTIFCGIETPEEVALKFMHKEQNLRTPILESIQLINDYGIEVVSGIIIGLDTDTPDTGKHITQFIHQSKLPMLTVNLLQALPKTPLWRRLEAANRIVERGGDHESNVEYLMPYDTVVRTWLECVGEVYAPGAIYDRFQHQIDHVYPKRKRLPVTKARLNWSNVKRGLSMLGRILYYIGLKADYRETFWKMVKATWRRGDIEGIIHTAIVSHHMILFARECANGQAEKSFYGFGDTRPDSQAPSIPQPSVVGARN